MSLKFKDGDIVIFAQKDFFREGLYGMVGIVDGVSDRKGLVNVKFPGAGRHLVEITELERSSKEALYGQTQRQ